MKYFKTLDHIFFISYLEYTAYDILKDNLLSQKSIRRIKNIYKYTLNNTKILKNILVKKFVSFNRCVSVDVNQRTEMIESFWHEFQSIVAVTELSEYMCDARK